MDIEVIRQINIGNEENIFGKNKSILVKIKEYTITLIESKGYFINGGNDKDVYPIIKCTTSSNCQKVGINDNDIVKNLVP